VQAKASQDLHHRLRDELDVAKLQQYVLRALGDSANGADGPRSQAFRAAAAEALHQLNWTLKNPSDLYNDYAYRFELWRACLQIIKECECSDPDEIHALYRKLLSAAAARAIGAGQAPDSLDRLRRALADCVTALGREFFDPATPRGHTSVFPYEYLVHGLEDLATFYVPAARARLGMAQQQQQQQTQEDQRHEWSPWVLRTMLEVGVSFDLLFEAYSNYIAKIRSGAHPLGLAFISDNTQEDTEFYNDSSKLFAAHAIEWLVTEWLRENGGRVGEIVSQHNVSDLLESVAVIVGGLHGEDVTQQSRQRLLNSLQHLITRIHG
jgi:hypothetical protein